MDTGHADDLSLIGADLRTYRTRPLIGMPTPSGAGTRYRTLTRPCRNRAEQHRDVVTCAPELARLSLNIAATHHDWRVGGQRFVYGGHTIGLALRQVSRLLPNLAMVLR